MRIQNFWLLIGFSLFFSACSSQKETISAGKPLFRRDHNLSLPKFGPYSKRFLGITHVADSIKGRVVEFPLSLALMGGKSIPWNPDKDNQDWTLLKADEQLGHFVQRYYLFGKEGLYGDAEYTVLDDRRFLCKLRLVNNTLVSRQISVVQALLHEWEAPGISLYLPDNTVKVEGEEYTALHSYHRYGTDGELPCVRRMIFASEGKALEGHFGEWPDDSVLYVFSNPAPYKRATLYLRYCKVYNNAQKFALTVDGRLFEAAFVKTCDRYANLAGWKYLAVPLGEVAAGEHRLVLSVAEPQNHLNEKRYERNVYTFPVGADLEKRTEFALDFFCLTEGHPAPEHFVERIPEPQNALSFQSAGGLAVVRDSRLDAEPWFAFGTTDSGAAFTPFADRYSIKEVTEHHHRFPLPADSATPSADVVTAPGLKLTLPVVDIPARSERTITFAGARAADSASATAAWRALANQPGGAGAATGFSTFDAEFGPSVEHLLAYCWGDVSYPNEILGYKVLGVCPSKFKFTMLYTWDGGMTAVGQSEFSAARAAENMLQYLDEGGDQRGFIEHGTGLPTQIYALWELYQRTGDLKILGDLYPGARNAYRFYAGLHPASTSLRNGNGLINTSNIWYNAIGMDDYPVQKYCAENNLLAGAGFPETNASAIRFAKILRLAARALGREEDIAGYGRDIDRLLSAIDTLWDEASGYYCYTSQGKKLFFGDSVNFNRGISGVYPLAAGLQDSSRERRLVGHLQNSAEMWSPIGISTVDRSAPYYSPDGYWNGRVWIAHQWILWKALLDLGDVAFAEKVARTALTTYSGVEKATGTCFENFIIATGEGSGTPHFAALSAPIVNFYCAYFRPGRVNTGFDVTVAGRKDDADGFPVSLTLDAPFGGRPASGLVMVLKPRSKYDIGGAVYETSASGSVSVTVDTRKPTVVAIRKL